MNRPLWIVAVIASLGACGGPAGDDGPSPGDPDASAGDPDASACPDPVDCAEWVEEYIEDVVARLSGERPIAEGLSLSARHSVAERDAARQYILDELTGHGLDAAVHDYGTGGNPFAQLAATGADAGTIVVGAHFDGVAGAPAAGDDATGVAIVLSAARYLSELPEREYSYIFVLYDEEEVGLVGSGAFAEKLTTEGTNVVAAHSYDMISFDGDGDGAIELWEPAAGLETLYRDVGSEHGITVHAIESFDRSDHASMIAAGFDAVGVSEEFVSGDFTPHYHTPQDSFDKVNFAYLSHATRFAFRVLSSPHP